MGSTLIKAPTQEPVTLSQAKAHLRVDLCDEDDLISNLIVAAREYCQTYTNRALVSQDWRLSLDCFPVLAGVIEVPRPPLISVSKIDYVDDAGVTQTLDPSDYRVDAESEPGRITPAFDTTWPATRAVTNAVKVEYSAGYGAAAAVPKSIYQAMLQLIGHLYANRETVVLGTIASTVPFTVTALLDPHRIIRFV